MRQIIANVLKLPTPFNLSMSPSPDSKSSQNASLEASEWFVIINSGKVTRSQRQAFEQWLAQSPLHRQCWQQTQMTWQGMNHFSATDIQDLKSAVLQPIGAASRPKRLARIQRYAFGAAALVLVAVISQRPVWYADYYTNVGESKQITLSDGSVLELDTDTAISVDYTDGRRRIILHQGEAYFTVAADTKRPFDVITGETDVQALGTEFDVSRAGDDMQVTVFEHSVRVSAADQSIDKLASGQCATFKNHQLGQTRPQNLSAINGWRQHRLTFEDQRLDEVIAVLNRYRHVPIVLLGDQIKGLSVTGLFDTQDTESALQAIEETLAVKIQRLPAGLVVISAA